MVCGGTQTCYKVTMNQLLVYRDNMIEQDRFDNSLIISSGILNLRGSYYNAGTTLTLPVTHVNEHTYGVVMETTSYLIFPGT